MTARMSMRERREKIETLVQNNPRVQACANEFSEAQAAITDWHVRNDALCATKAELGELADLISYSEFCLEGLKCAKTAAYNQLMSQYPRVWDATCDDPFDTGAQDDATDTGIGAETEEMSTVPATKIAHSHDLTASIGECPLCGPLERDRIAERAALAARAQNLHMLTDKYIRQLETGTLGYDGLGEWTERLLEAGDDWSSHQSAVTNAEWRYRNAITVHSALAAARRCETEGMEEVPADTECPRIPLAEVKNILTKWETDYKGFRDFLAVRGLNPVGAACVIFAIKEIRDDINKLTTTEEAPNA